MSNTISNITNAYMSPALSWIVLAAVIATDGGHLGPKRGAQALAGPERAADRNRRREVGAAAVGGIVLVYICNLNRGTLTAIKGVPWVIPIVGLMLYAFSILLGRTQLGRYIYAIGANPEGARRAGINVPRIRTIAFMLCSMTAGVAGLLYLSRLGSIATDYDGGGIVLYAVAAAVIGGASLFGGRGKPLHALLGGFVIAAVYNGLFLLGIATWGVYVSFGVVLLLAAIVDSTLRRRGTGGRV